ncbi:MAG: sigma 54-dependent Fis family transcriptional regulator [Deltaproteobacteria bacterium]|nr:MAG: sigma 54-dependent Fis family transcriptional regulator [Deltaproteobacteria bacterium]
MPALHFYKGERSILRLPLSGSDINVGRHPDNDLTLSDEEISRFHFTIRKISEGFQLTDKSRNGTFVNGKKVTAAFINPHDEIQIGPWRAVFVSESSSEKETIVKKTAPQTQTFAGMVGTSAAMQRVFKMIDKAAPTDVTVLVIGETGTGKELAARAIHDRSPRERKPYVALNCGAISPQLIESELFGHERGAFTGAAGRHLGVFEQARGGTLVLDQIGELPLGLQPKLLGVLEEKKFRRVGGVEDIVADVRIVAATHRNLEQMSHEGKFREDLFFRLFSVPIHLPPLRERTEDIPHLVNFFLETLSQAEDHHMSVEAMQKLVQFSWRGNIRELKNVMTRTLLFAPNTEIEPQDILFLSDQGSSSKPSLQSVEKEAIMKALRENNWNKKETSEALGIAKSTLFHKIKEYDIQTPEK